jgi:hypothetical protein
VSEPRLIAKIEVSALIRRIETLGGSGMVLARGHSEAGTILLLLADRGEPRMLLERALDPSGAYKWQKTGPQDVGDKGKFNLYIESRRRFDPDIWIVELDIAGVEQFADEMIVNG